MNNNIEGNGSYLQVLFIYVKFMLKSTAVCWMDGLKKIRRIYIIIIIILNKKFKRSTRFHSSYSHEENLRKDVCQTWEGLLVLRGYT